ncbi:ABC transporter substrate-binding protein [Agromyces sp. MMS24-K17]|uniref:ABC transporter substrate-binding protein n=1 Tax=Agromyces sp. MMS24-K17 TaxID=3372850 RepID=UPI003754D570
MPAPSARPPGRIVRRAAAVALAAACALAATSCATPTEGAAAGGDPVDGGSLAIGLGTVIDCFDPQVSPAGITAAVLRNVYDSLVAQNPDGSFSPWLASSWEVSDDGLTYTFELRDDVTFHDGTPFDAEAVKANLDRIVDPATASQYAGALIAPYRETEILDDHAVAVHLDSPYSPFLSAVASTNLGFHSPASIAEYGDDLCQGGPAQVGTGPFEFASVQDGEGFRFTRNDAYDWAPDGAAHDGPAHLAEVDYRFLTESSVRLGALTSGEVGFIDQVATTDLATVEATPGIVLESADPTGIPYTYFLNTSHPPFDDERARRAIQEGVDFDAITEAIFQGAYAPATAPLNPATFAAHPDLGDAWDYDPDGAADLLAELGYTERDADGYLEKDGERLSIELIYDPTYQRPERITYDTAVQEALRTLGIELVITPIGDGTYIDVRNTGAYDVVAFAWSGADPDVLRTIYGSDQQLADGGGNGSHATDPELDALLADGILETDPAAREPIYRSAQELIIDRVYGIPAYGAPVLTAHADGVQGLSYGTAVLPGLYDAWTPLD